MRDKALATDFGFFTDHELLEMVLYLAFPRDNTKPIARRLIAHFGHFADICGATNGDLAAVDGMTEAGVAILKIVGLAAVRLRPARAVRWPVLSNWTQLISYLDIVMVQERAEQTHILFLDNKNRLLRDELPPSNRVGCPISFVREVFTRALELQAAAIILAHNRCCSNVTPSEDDIRTINHIVKAGQSLSIAVHDYVIVGSGDRLSCRKQGLL